MILKGAISENSKTNLVVGRNIMNTEEHIKILYVQLLAYCAHLEGKNFIFQEDGATCHISKAEKKYI